MVGQFKPLLTVSVKSAEVSAEKIFRGCITQHGEKGGIGIEQLAVGIAAADAVRGVGDQRAEIRFGDNDRKQ